MQLTSQASQHSQITRNTQIDNISVEQMAMSLGSDLDHLVEALEEVFCTPHTHRGTGYTRTGVSLTNTVL